MKLTLLKSMIKIIVAFGFVTFLVPISAVLTAYWVDWGHHLIKTFGPWDFGGLF